MSACTSPLKAWKRIDGVVFVGQERGDGLAFFLACGRCTACRLKRSADWATRCMHEASLHEFNCFLTLTYSDDKLPLDRNLNYRHFQLFMKRLRKHFQGASVRFYMCGEYGEETGRPHYHAIVFGVDFKDKTYFKKSPSGATLWKSETLDRLWSHGQCLLGDVTFESAAYTARYVMKKIVGQGAEGYYNIIDPDTGEIYARVPEFARMSLRSAIGRDWMRLYWSDVYPGGKVVVNGKEVRAPRYYDKMAKKLDCFIDVRDSRADMALYQARDSSPERLAVKAQVLEARLTKLKRG